MTTEREEEAGPVTVQIGVCSVCHALFMLSGDRLTSPCHGADPLAVLATLTIGPDAQVTGEWGLGTVRAPLDITEEPAPAVDEEQPAPAAAEGEAPISQEPTDTVDFIALISMFLVGVPESGDELRGAFTASGAEPEAASTAVGRLSAVRELLEQLSAAREPAPVAAAPSEAEKSPENT